VLVALRITLEQIYFSTKNRNIIATHFFFYPYPAKTGEKSRP